MTKNNNNQETLNAVLRNDLSYFIQKSFYATTGHETYHYSSHIDVIGEGLQKCIDGGIKRLIINVPPRYLKSICASVAFPAWILANRPNAQITAASYNEDLEDYLSRDTLTLMKSHWYQDLFPAIRIDPKFERKDEFKTTARGDRFAISIGSTLIGKGGEFILIDDPLKDSDARSKSQIDTVNKWFCDTVITRPDNKGDGVMIVIMQRLHENDLTGFILESNIPVIAEKDEEWVWKNGLYGIKAGEALHPRT